jgi:uncharacterized protein YbbC (DUF1343 family)
VLSIKAGFRFGIDTLIGDPALSQQLKGRRIALLGHPASLTSTQPPGSMQHSLDALMKNESIQLSAAFGPQHGMRGEKQDNMIETKDTFDPQYKIPVFSLYGEVRSPTDKMMDTFDVLLVDLQDIGTRIYTYLTTLSYVLEACEKKQKTIWILDRPNPAGRPVEGTALRPGWQSFVGSDRFPMRHGLTLGECALWFKKTRKLNVDLKVIAMQNYEPDRAPGYGWPVSEVSWVNPSPNASSLSMARCFPGTVILEGTHFSEGRGTTIPLEIVGAPDIDGTQILQTMHEMASQWMQGCHLRPCYFQPTFHKHVGQMCSGFQIHVDHLGYQHGIFKPYRLMALFFKAVRKIRPDYSIWRDFHYEYEKDRLAVDLLTGSSLFREWVDDTSAKVDDFEKLNTADEKEWLKEREEYLLYR